MSQPHIELTVFENTEVILLDVLILSNNFSSMVVCIFWTILRLLIKSVLKKKCIHQTFCVEGTCHCVHSFKFY